MPPSDTAELVRAELSTLLSTRGTNGSFDDDTPLTQLRFRSIDFAELALAIETRSECELDFDAVDIGRIDTVGDVVRYFDAVLRA